METDQIFEKNKYFIKMRPSFFGDRFLIEDSNHNIVLRAWRYNFTAVRIKVFNPVNDKDVVIKIEPSTQTLMSPFNVLDISGACIAKINGCLHDLNSNTKYERIFTGNLDFDVPKRRKIHFKICCNAKVISDLQYINLFNAELNFYDDQGCILDRRLGIAMALVSMF